MRSIGFLSIESEEDGGLLQLLKFTQGFNVVQLQKMKEKGVVHPSTKKKKKLPLGPRVPDFCAGHLVSHFLQDELPFLDGHFRKANLGTYHEIFTNICPNQII